ncbi:hypothetical protein IscW_ISCW010326 [Ixodes scapularis]|uniref:5'-Nucleotidase C-terminal domain-containing protein n=1 Tax=Ixodes scapularis TaxID=6945 RepID=B7Q5E4_IXOSC|nr:hypothetical protein IscW_ISCW010326 [Ixodes scapularis]|eukprot:XP_002401859.1 hypothetical protein IscW_ISCW010326 [Ixodes scapularis]
MIKAAYFRKSRVFTGLRPSCLCMCIFRKIRTPRRCPFQVVNCKLLAYRSLSLASFYIVICNRALHKTLSNYLLCTVLRKHVMEAMPFESSLVVLTMNGNQLQKMFDDGISKFTWYGDPEGSFLQVSDMNEGGL